MAWGWGSACDLVSGSSGTSELVAWSRRWWGGARASCPGPTLACTSTPPCAVKSTPRTSTITTTTISTHQLQSRLHLVRHHVGPLALLKRMAAQNPLSHLCIVQVFCHLYKINPSRLLLVADLRQVVAEGRWERGRRCCTTWRPPSGRAWWSCARPGSTWSLACRSPRPAWTRNPALAVFGRSPGGFLQEFHRFWAV